MAQVGCGSFSKGGDIAFTKSIAQENAQFGITANCVALGPIDTPLVRDGKSQDPMASPLYGDLAGLPPLLIQVGGRETLLDGSRMLAKKAKSLGVDVRMEIWETMIRVFQLYDKELVEAREAGWGYRRIPAPTICTIELNQRNFG